MLERWIRYVHQMWPATLAGVCIAGASYGFTLLWVVIISAVFGVTPPVIMNGYYGSSLGGGKLGRQERQNMRALIKYVIG